MPESSFAVATRRHYEDAEFLFSGRRCVSADHLAGLAAECGLKAILLKCGEAKMNSKSGKPVLVAPNSGEEKSLGHVDELWNQLPLIVSGRSAKRFTALVARPAPFATWRITDRYSDGTTITAECARKHLDAAGQILGLLEQAEREGTLP
ncbi:MAG: hypothetical protein ACRDPW_09260 [Mycobacteriales bacterium]